MCAPWEVVSVTKREQAEGLSCGVVTIELAIRKGQLVPCPKCGRMCKRHDRKWREWRHRDLMEWRTLLRAAVPRANCPEHGVHQIDVPWAESHGRQTVALERAVIDDLKLMSMQAAARKHGLGGSQVSRLMERAVARGLARREQRHPKRIGIDETSFQKRHEYVTLVTDHDPARGRRGTVLHVADGKDSNAIEGFFKELGLAGCAGIETAAMDFAPAYMKAAFVHTNADICIDHFHVTSLVVKALEQVRRTEHSKLTRQGDDRLKGTRFDWLMTPERMPPQRRKRLDEMLKQDLRVCEAWRLKEWVAEIWALKDRRHAYHAWEAWYQEVMRSGLSPMMRAARTIWKHIEEILNASMLGISNALSESINSKVQWIKRQACGYRNRRNFRAAIYFHLGGLDLYPRPTFHTLP